MFVYLSKRIAIPNGVVITSIGWNEEQDWLATGGEGGLLKVLKVDGGQQGRKSGGLSLNQTLEGHEHAVTHVAWNHRWRKLTSSDKSGRIIVWTLHKGMWFEEMVNNRQASHVVDLMWSGDGSRVCIAYADGAVIVGNVDGNRLWGQNFDYQLARVCWSPSDRYLIFGTVAGEVYVHYAEAGQLVSQIKVVFDDSHPSAVHSSSSSSSQAVPGAKAGSAAVGTEDTQERLVGLLWHPGWVDRPEPLSTFAICFDSGRLQLMNGIGDENPYLVDTGIHVQYIAWNPAGTILALTGRSSSSSAAAAAATLTSETAAAASENSAIITQFYSNEAIHLRSLRVSGRMCGGLAWESDGLRIAIAVDSSVYFANIRPSYRFCYFKKTLVYTYARPDRVEESVTFWNVKTNERTTKQVRGLIFLDACHGGACAMVSKPHRTRPPCMVQLLSPLSTPMETKFIPFEPYACAMNSSHVVCAGEENVFLWQFRDPGRTVDLLDPVSVQVGRRESRERVIHIDDFVQPDRAPDATAAADDATAVRTARTNDLICAVAVSESAMIVARESGLVHRYGLTPLRLLGKLLLPFRPHTVSVNRDATRLAAVDLSGHLRVYALPGGAGDYAGDGDSPLMVRRAETPSGEPAVERKDVWGVRWASDEPDWLAVMEKTRLTVFRAGVAEEPVASSGNVCKFKSLRVHAVQLDDLLADPDRPRKECLLVWEVGARREMRRRIDDADAADASAACASADGDAEARDAVARRRAVSAYAEQVDEPTVWRLLAEFALRRLDFTVAEVALIRVRNYPAIQFVKRVRGLDEPAKQRAEVEAYHGHVDEAERMYKEMDRKDLALDLRARLGDWFGVVRLVQEGGGDESLMARAWERIGDHYAHGQKWSKAIQYYTQCKQYDKLATVFFATEDYEMLAQLIVLAEHDAPLLRRLAAMFLRVGLAEAAARAFVAAGAPRLAVEGCVSLKQWERALSLAQEQQTGDVDAVVSQYAAHLVSHDRLAEALALHRHAGQHDAAARLLGRLGGRAGAAHDALRAKKFFVLSALEWRRHRRGGASSCASDKPTTTTATAANNDQTAARRGGRKWDADGAPGGGGGGTEDIWRGAEGYHFYLLCQANLLERNLRTAFVLAMRLTGYEDVIAPVDSYRLIALTAYLVENYGVCSSAFTRLEAAERGDAAAAGDRSAGSLVALPDFSLDLDVTQRGATTMHGGGARGGGNVTASAAHAVSGSSLDGTTTATRSAGGDGGSGGGAAASTYPTVPLDEPEFRFAQLAAQIFTRHPPVDASVRSVPCGTCGTFNTEWAVRCERCEQPFSVCIVSGRAIVSDEESWQCHVCHHRAAETEVERYSNCPLCHSPKKTRLRHAL